MEQVGALKKAQEMTEIERSAPPPRARAFVQPHPFRVVFCLPFPPPPPCYSLAAIVSFDMMVVNFLFVLLFVQLRAVRHVRGFERRSLHSQVCLWYHKGM